MCINDILENSGLMVKFNEIRVPMKNMMDLT
jgi:hypothetical protein